MLSILHTFFHSFLTVNGHFVKLMSLSSSPQTSWCCNRDSANHIPALPDGSCLALPEGGCKARGGRKDLLLLVCFLFPMSPQQYLLALVVELIPAAESNPVCCFFTTDRTSLIMPTQRPVSQPGSALLRGLSPNPARTLLQFPNFNNFRSFSFFSPSPKGGSCLPQLLPQWHLTHVFFPFQLPS